MQVRSQLNSIAVTREIVIEIFSVACRVATKFFTIGCNYYLVKNLQNCFIISLKFEAIAISTYKKMLRTRSAKNYRMESSKQNVKNQNVNILFVAPCL
jgi:hypothetical protein